MHLHEQPTAAVIAQMRTRYRLHHHAALDKIDRACDSSCHYTGDHTAQKVAWIAFLEQTIFQNMVLCMIITGYL